ncbi:DUF1003 domain-containing protein [soil metagenome]
MDRTPARRRQDARKEHRRDRSHEPRRESRGPRLDVPTDTRRQIIRRPNFDSDTFVRFAETFARFMGTARFLMYMTGFVVVWLLWNALAPDHLRFDPYAFIFLTLILSLQASYAAPLILLAQNRQEDRDRVIGEQDRTANARAHADMEFLAREMASIRMALGEVATRDYVRSELRSLLQDLGELQKRETDEHSGEDWDT